MPIALNENIEAGVDRISVLMGVRSRLPYTDRHECEC